jgi:electron transport complex protein RnfB
MGDVALAAGIMFGIALFFGVILAVAYKKMRVEEDPRIDEVVARLPGANCGACGQPGCRAFAELTVQGKLSPGKCTVNTADGIADIADYLGVAADLQEKRVARLHCAGGKSAVRDLADYRGAGSCRSAVVVNGGGRACPWGCLGLGDCARACSFDAITMNAEGLPVVDVMKCTACNDCVVVCPLSLFSIHAISDHVLVQCSSPLTGLTAKASCHVACDACGRCALDAPENVIVMQGGLPIVKAPSIATATATFRCPTGAIQWVDGNQFTQETTARRRHA